MEAHNEQHAALPRPLAVVVATLVACVVVSVWVGAARRGLEYDEVWTLQEYARAPSVARIFADTTPNNHPANSLLIRWTTSVFGKSEWAVRLPALVAGTCLLVWMPFAVRRLAQRWEVGLLAAAWVAASAPLMHYAQTARGYSLQALLIFAYTAFVLTAYAHREHEGRNLTLAVISGIVGMFALPTTVLFLLPVAAVDIVARAIRWRKRVPPARARVLVEEWRPFVAYTTLAIVCAGWIARSSVGFAESLHRYAMPISSPSQWFHFCADVLGRLDLWPLVILSFMGLGLCLTNRVLWTLTVTAFWLLLAAWPLRGWPPRAYVPLVPLVCTAAAMGLCDLLDRIHDRTGGKLRSGIVTTMAILPAFILLSAERSWMPLDWKHVGAAVRETAGPKASIVYPAYGGFVLAYYYAPEILWESLQRLPDSASTLVLTEADSRMTGVDAASGRSMTLFCPEQFRLSTEHVPGTTVELTRYAFDSLPRVYSPNRIMPESVYFIQLGPGPRVPVAQRFRKLGMGSGIDEWQLVNPHLKLVMNQSGETVLAFLLATTNVDALVREWTNTVSWGSVPVSFYQLVPPKLSN